MTKGQLIKQVKFEVGLPEMRLKLLVKLVVPISLFLRHAPINELEIYTNRERNYGGLTKNVICINMLLLILILNSMRVILQNI